MITSSSKRRVFSLSVEINAPWSAFNLPPPEDSIDTSLAMPTAAMARDGGYVKGVQPCCVVPLLPQKSPLHGDSHGAKSPHHTASDAPVVANGFDRLLMLRQMQVTGDLSTSSSSTISQRVQGNVLSPIAHAPPHPVFEVSAAQNHKERKAAEALRRQEVARMAQEDYVGTPEGDARMARQNERAHMAEEELYMIRIVSAEKAQRRAEQLQQQRDADARTREMYLAKMRMERDVQQQRAKEQEEERRRVTEEKMKALKAAADAKAREEYTARQTQLATSELLAKEQRISDMETALLAIEDVIAVAMRQQYNAECERKRQIAIEEAQWKQFEAIEAQKQLEATLARRATQAEQYEQDKQRRMEIHRLQRERARLAEEKQQKHKQLQHLSSLNPKTSDTGSHYGDQDQAAAIVQENPENIAEIAVNTMDFPNQEVGQATLRKEVACDAESNASTTLIDIPKQNDLQMDHHILDLKELPPLNGEAKAAHLEEDKGEGQCEPHRGDQSHEREYDHNDDEPTASTHTALDVEKDQDSPKIEQLDCFESTKSTAAVMDDPPVLYEPNQSIIAVADTANSKLDADNALVAYTKQTKTAETSYATDSSAAPEDSDRFQYDSMTAPTTVSTREARRLRLHPFAQVAQVKQDSPAMEAALQADDLLIHFGGITSMTPNCLLQIAQHVQAAVNQEIELLVLRPEQHDIGGSVEMYTQAIVRLRPRKWKGKGLLGCQLNPFHWPEEIESDVEATGTDIDDTGADVDAHLRVLVFCDVLSDSIAAQSGIQNGDLLMQCDELGDKVTDFAAVSRYLETSSTTRRGLGLQRWLPEEQCYEQLHVSLLASSSSSESLGCTLTTFAAYYYGMSRTPATVESSQSSSSSPCLDCYYTTLATSIHAAALQGHVNCLEALYQASHHEIRNAEDASPRHNNNAMLDWRDDDGRSPLFYACFANQVACVQFVLSCLMRNDEIFDPVTGSDLYGDSPLHAATSSDCSGIVILLLESKYIHVDVVNHAQVACVHVAPNLAMLQLLGEQFNADLLVTDSDGRMPLTHACLRNDVESVAYLCAKHPDFVDYADASGNTPLHLTAWMGFVDVLTVLLQYVPSIALFVENQDGANALDVALASESSECAIILQQRMDASDVDNGLMPATEVSVSVYS
uniref:PDZ domain-containing protein n=1 Tax=Globisporangium ultimum (strain ATCC 200006 / CBS 805.95 / DAOM BR144) TaxID=431595 RepID=K3X9F2_GLOUD